LKGSLKKGQDADRCYGFFTPLSWRGSGSFSLDALMKKGALLGAGFRKRHMDKGLNKFLIGMIIERRLPCSGIEQSSMLAKT